VNRRAVIGLLIGAVVVAAVVIGIRVAGSVVRRPEGAAERFLQAASRRSAKDRATASRYGDPRLARQLIDFERKDRNEDFFHRIEIARSTKEQGVASVPFRVERNDRAGTKRSGYVTVEQRPGRSPRGWRVVGIASADLSAVRFPSDGGPKPAGVPGTTWLIALGLGLVFTLGSEALLRALGAQRQFNAPRLRPPPTGPPATG
jgi:hypothetical protein